MRRTAALEQSWSTSIDKCHFIASSANVWTVIYNSSDASGINTLSKNTVSSSLLHHRWYLMQQQTATISRYCYHQNAIIHEKHYVTTVQEIYCTGKNSAHKTCCKSQNWAVATNQSRKPNFKTKCTVKHAVVISDSVTAKEKLTKCVFFTDCTGEC